MALYMGRIYDERAGRGTCNVMDNRRLFFGSVNLPRWFIVTISPSIDDVISLT